MARQPKKTTVTVEKYSLDKVRADILVLGLFKDTKRLPAELAALDQAAGQVISNLLKLGDFTGTANQTAVLYTNGSLPFSLTPFARQPALPPARPTNSAPLVWRWPCIF